MVCDADEDRKGFREPQYEKVNDRGVVAKYLLHTVYGIWIGLSCAYIMGKLHFAAAPLLYAGCLVFRKRKDGGRENGTLGAIEKRCGFQCDRKEIRDQSAAGFSDQEQGGDWGA